MTFFTDECFIHKANALLEAFDRHNQIRAFLDCFNAGTPDEEWIPAVSRWEPKPVVISGDFRILKNKVQRQVLSDAGLTFVCLTDGWLNMRWNEYAWKLIKAWPNVVESTAAVLRPTVFEVSGSTLKVGKRYSL